MALLTSAIPLAMDAMLPAFPEIGQTYGGLVANELQMIVVMLVLGFGCGQIFVGPVSDAYGRKFPIYLGLGIFVLGALLSAVAPTYEFFLAGRFLQGFGGAAPRVVSMALVRDEYSGNAMAELTSLIMTVFILTPAISPALGQGILLVWGWRAIFASLFFLGVIAWIWFAFRQHETLPKDRRCPLSFSQALFGFKEAATNRTTVCAVFISGLVFGVFVGYLGSVQAVFVDLYDTGRLFPIYFAALALSIGAATFFNSKLVMRFGMRRLLKLALLWMHSLGLLFSAYLWLKGMSVPPLWLFVTYMMLTFLSVGFLFGNLNALGMEPLGHVAGIGSAFIGFFQAAISVCIGLSLGQYFHYSILPLSLSFMVVGFLGVLLLSLEAQSLKA